METAELKQQLKKQIIEFLNLISVKPEDIKDDEPLFGEGLGLDSIDSIELIVLLGREYGIDIKDPKEGRKVLTDININYFCLHFSTLVFILSTVHSIDSHIFSMKLMYCDTVQVSHCKISVSSN